MPDDGWFPPKKKQLLLHLGRRRLQPQMKPLNALLAAPAADGFRSRVQSPLTSDTQTQKKTNPTGEEAYTKVRASSSSSLLFYM
jgi:hypothetical protein